MALDNFNKDPNRPAEYVDTAYEALKHNPQATQQILQQGQNAGLAGLGAMAANRYQQRAQLEQKGQQAQQMAQQPPTPTVLQQQLQAMMQQGGIMAQLPNSIQMAQASQQAPEGGAGLGDLPVDPNTLPQEMAGGGLVALAQGGYLDGYADGGQVRGFATGTSEMLRAMGIPDAANYFSLGEDLTDADSKILQELMAEDEARYRDRMIRKRLAGEGVPESSLQSRGKLYSPEVPETPASYKEIYGETAPRAETYGSRPSYTEKYGAPAQAAEYTPYKPNIPETPIHKPSMIEGMSQAAHAPTHPMAEAMAKSGKAPFEAPRTMAGTVKNVGKAAKALGKLAGPLGTVSGAYDMFEALSDPAFQEQYKKDWKENMPSWMGGDGEKPPHINKPKEEMSEVAPVFQRSLMDGNHLAEGATRLVQQEAMRSPEREPTTPEMADRNIEQGRQMLSSDQGGIPAARPQLTSGESYGVPNSMGAGNIEEQLAKIKAMRGGAPSRPAGESDRYAQMLEDANTQKWIQTLTGAAIGALAGGGKNWSQVAGLGAQYGMNAYNRGAEEEGKLEMAMLERAAQEQEAERKFNEASADKLLGIQTEKMKLNNAAAIASERADLRRELDAAKAERSAAYAGAATDAQKLTAWNQASERARKELEEAYTNKLEPIPPGKLEELTNRYYQAALMGTGIGFGGGFGGLGGGQGLGGGRPIGSITSAGGFHTNSRVN